MEDPFATAVAIPVFSTKMKASKVRALRHARMDWLRRPLRGGFAKGYAMKKICKAQPFTRILFILFTLLFMCFCLSPPRGFSMKGQHGHSAASGEVPLIEGLVDLDFSITTDNPKAQEYFNQALVLTYGFDHADAEVSYLKAAELDPEAAMAWWGAAFVLGPNINAPMDDAAVPKAYERAQKALELSGSATEKEQALIRALAERYAPGPQGDRSGLDNAFAEAMGRVYQRYPDDPNVAVLYAESLMDLHPWNYWTEDDKAQPWTPRIEALLEKVIAGHPNHPHGHHLYIHLMENSPRPEATVKSADIIRHLVPAAGHLVHMAGHGYYAAGLYHDCSVVNEEAIGVDKVLKSSFDTSGLYQLAYMPHNLHFLLASYMMEGRSKDAVAAARTLAAGVDRQQMRQPGLASLQHFYLTPYYALVRFGMWDEVLAEAAPPADLKYPTAMWHYARGMAFTRKGDLEKAGEELSGLKAAANDPQLADMKIWDLNKVTDLLAVASNVLAGELAAAKGDDQAALGHFERGVALQDRLAFDEPPTWYYPVRQSLGTHLYRVGRIHEAEEVFRKDLLKNAENPYSLYGLAQCLKSQDKALEADEAERRFRRAWSRADLEMKRPVF
jgi:tetratricopeptide (TPR) repeat protein